MRPRPPDPPGSFRLAGLQLAGLAAFAVAQPLFDLLARNAEFFAVRGSSRWDVVLFAVGVVVLPPLTLLAVEALAGLADARAATWLHLVFVGALAALVVLGAIRAADAPPAALVAAAAAAGALAALAYRRLRAARALATVLGAAPAVFAGMFLLASPVSPLVLEAAPHPVLAEVPARSPVVVIVLDELPTSSLLDTDGRIDAVRYPSFARLAADATWYRNATTVHEWTTAAVPAIVTGLLPRRGALPLYRDHPDSLFTLLGGSYRLRVSESQTHLCPEELCDEARSPLPTRVASLLSDLSIVYGHLALPEEYGSSLPDISTAWGEFGEDGPVARLDEGPDEPGGRAGGYIGRDEDVARFVESIEPGGPQTLWFLHTLLPHHPWEYLPNGKVYASDLGTQPGLVNERWVGDPELAVQAQQRHLLQVGYVDLLLGRVLDRLDEAGLYEDALVVVVADHGVGFRPHGERRRANAGNLEEIAFVPLLVKAPGQTAGRIDDRAARTVDVLPTIADLLGVEVPWRTDGRSLLEPAGVDARVAVRTASGEIASGELDALVSRRGRLVERQAALFGTGAGRPGLFAAGPRPELLGLPVASLRTAPPGEAAFASLGETEYDPLSAFAPVRVYGAIRDAPGPQDLAIAVNGRIAATTRSFVLDGRTLVSAVLPEEAFRPGANDVRLYAATGFGAAAVLTPLPAP